MIARFLRKVFTMSDEKDRANKDSQRESRQEEEKNMEGPTKRLDRSKKGHQDTEDKQSNKDSLSGPLSGEEPRSGTQMDQ